MGVAYIHRETPKSTSTVRSRYLVVRLDTMIPKPIPRTPRCTSSTGIISQASQFGCTWPRIRKYVMNRITSSIWIRKRIPAEITLEMGVVSRGK